MLFLLKLAFRCGFNDRNMYSSHKNVLSESELSLKSKVPTKTLHVTDSKLIPHYLTGTDKICFK